MEGAVNMAELFSQRKLNLAHTLVHFDAYALTHTRHSIRRVHMLRHSVFFDLPI